MLHRKARVVPPDSVRRSIDNSAQTLLANIRFMSVDNPVRTVVITSAIPNEGKTFVAANLAHAMATSGIRTLVVECDMRRRSMAAELNVHAKRGLYSVVSGVVPLKDAVVSTSTNNLFFLDAEPHIPNPPDLLNSRKFQSLIEEAKKEFGYVVFDTPPVGTFVDAAVLGAKVDAVLMVVRERFTRKDEVARAANQLKTANVPLSGIVMNQCEQRSSEYYYEYYYREDAGPRRSVARGSSAEDAMRVALAGASDEEGRAPATTASAARASRTATRRSWNNAPDLGDAENNDELGNTGDITIEHTARPRHSAIPSIGETGMMQRSDLDQSQ